MTEQDYSYVVTAFLVAYAIMYAGSGYLVDRIGTRAGLRCSSSHGPWPRCCMGSYRESGRWPGRASWTVPARRLAGRSQSDRRMVSGEPARAGNRNLQCRHIGGLGSRASRGGLPDDRLWMALRLRRPTASTGLAWMVLWLLLYEPPHKNRFLTRRISGDQGPRTPARRDCARGGRQRELAQSDGHARMLHAHHCALLHRPRHLLHHLLAARILAQGEAFRPRHGRQVRLGAVHLRRHRLPSGRMALRLADAPGLVAPQRSKLHHADRRLFPGPVAILAPLVPEAWMAIAATCFATFGHAFWVANLQALPTDLFPGRRWAPLPASPAWAARRAAF